MRPDPVSQKSKMMTFSCLVDIASRLNDGRIPSLVNKNGAGIYSRNPCTRWVIVGHRMVLTGWEMGLDGSKV